MMCPPGPAVNPRCADGEHASVGSVRGRRRDLSLGVSRVGLSIGLCTQIADQRAGGRIHCVEEELVSRAVAAAASLAGALDLQVNDAVVMQNSNKLALRLLPCNVFARVALIGQVAAALEVELAQRLAAAGCPVAVLEPRVEPCGYESDGFMVTFWTYYEPNTPDQFSPADYAGALYRLHAGMRT